jgi:hypothetical protein
MNFEDKYKKGDLEKLIFEEKLPYTKIGEIYGVSDTYIKKVCKRLGIQLITRKTFPEGFKPYNTGTIKKIICLNCGKCITTSYDKQKFCSIRCSSEYKMNSTYENYLINQEQYRGILYDTKAIKPHILKEQNNLCDICRMLDIWNNKPIVFILDHIDGDASNNTRSNLRCVCPNCDSQLGTYKSKNKNSARKDRYVKNYKN